MNAFKQIFWIVIDPWGWIGYWEISPIRKQAIHDFMEEKDGFCYGSEFAKKEWRKYYKQGYRAIKIKLVPEDPKLWGATILDRVK